MPATRVHEVERIPARIYAHTYARVPGNPLALRVGERHALLRTRQARRDGHPTLPDGSTIFLRQGCQSRIQNT